MDRRLFIVSSVAVTGCNSVIPNLPSSADASASSISPTTIQITPASPLPAATQNTAYVVQLVPTGGVAPYTWSLMSATPDTGFWLSINSSTGVLGGTPGTAETETVNITVKDSAGDGGSQSFSLTVNAAGPALQITTNSPLPAALVGSGYSVAISATGGATPYTWSISSDTPDSGSWLSINPSTGVLSGTPGTPETETVVVKITDNAGQSYSQNFSLAVNAASLQITSSSPLPAATVGAAYSDTVDAKGGIPPYTWSITSDAPDTGSWLSINPSTGVLSGTPKTAETESVVVKITDSASHSSSQSFSLTVNATASTLQITTGASLPAATVGSAYTEGLSATGGATPYTWSISSDAPDTGSWLSINSSTGVLSGTPGTAETETVVVKVTDSASHNSTQSFSLVVNAKPLSISTSSSLPAATVGSVYSDTVAATGGVPPYTWSISSDAPDTGSWLSINASTGVLSGTPGTAETETVVVKVTDSASHSSTQSFSLVVNTKALSISTSSPLPAATVGSAYSDTVAATGGVPPYTWSISSDAPDTGSWLSINPSTGVLSGTPGTAENETV
jgi:xanthosine utilization system XapX-like protein